MPSNPCFTLYDDYTDGLRCAICGHPTLKVVHVDTLPDYVSCDHCSSAFVVEEDGNRVMYGVIDSAYTDTRRFVLRQWLLPEAVEKRAASEFPPTEPIEKPAVPFLVEPAPSEPPPAAVPIPTEPEIFPPPEPLVIETAPEPDADEVLLTSPPEPFTTTGAEIETPVVPHPEIEEMPAPISTAPAIEEEVSEEPPLVLSEEDPSPGQRFRVVLSGTKVKFPDDICAHCSGTPVRGRLAVAGSLPKGQVIGQRQTTTFKLPLCARCRKRAAHRSEEEKGARLQAHLVSALSALVLLVVAIAAGVNPLEAGPMGILILTLIAVVSYTIPALILLNRIGPYPISEDTAYVCSTLLVPKEVQSLETAFEWRNQTYAEQFQQANQEYTLGKLVTVKDRSHSPGTSTLNTTHERRP